MERQLDFDGELSSAERLPVRLSGDEVILVAAEVAALLRVTTAWVYAETRANRLPHGAPGPLRPLPRVGHPRLARGRGAAHRPGAPRMSPARRPRGTGRLYAKYGAWYGRWRTSDGRRLNRRLGDVRSVGEADGLTRSEAERAFRQAQDAEERSPTPVADRRRTVDDALEALRDRKTLEGVGRSRMSTCESHHRLHIAPALGQRLLSQVTRQDTWSQRTRFHR